MFIEVRGIGRVGKDPVLKVTQSGQDLLALSVACEYWNGSERVTQWWQVAIFGKKAKSLEPYIQKGTVVSFSGAPEWFAFIKEVQDANGEEDFQAAAIPQCVASNVVLVANGRHTDRETGEVSNTSGRNLSKLGKKLRAKKVAKNGNGAHPQEAADDEQYSQDEAIEFARSLGGEVADAGSEQ